MEKIKCVVRLGMVWGFSSFPTAPPNSGDLFPLDLAKVMQHHWKLRTQTGQAAMLCRDVAVNKVCKFCLTLWCCRSSWQWQRWGGSYTGAVLKFSCGFLVEMTPKKPTLKIVLLEAEFGLRFSEDNSREDKVQHWGCPRELPSSFLFPEQLAFCVSHDA